jgi:hypothetical protein
MLALILSFSCLYLFKTKFSSDSYSNTSPKTQKSHLQPPRAINLKKDDFFVNPSANLSINYRVVPVRVTFYSGLAIENGGYEEKNALGGPLKVGSLAAPSDIPFGTVFIIENLPTDVKTNRFSVDDRGGAITWLDEITMKVDVYVKRNPNESDEVYFKRVNALGVIYTEAMYFLP